LPHERDGRGPRRSGRLMMAEAIGPGQSSPAVMEKPLCSLSLVSFPPGVMMEKFGRCPRCASRTNDVLATLFAFWPVSRHSANEGQMSQMYPGEAEPPLSACG